MFSNLGFICVRFITPMIPRLLKENQSCIYVVDMYMYVPNMLSSKNKDISIIIIISGNAKGVKDLHTCSKKVYI